MPNYERTIRYYQEDFARTLFPLDTNRVVIENAAEDIGKFVYESITHEKESPHKFAPQTRAYASKPKHHLRRTLKLDPIAEFFFYDLTYRHRTCFRRSPSRNRHNFGYRFVGGRMLKPASSYRKFRKAVRKAMFRYGSCVKLDIAQYFNSLYHHDLVHWFQDYAKTDEDALFFGKFLREINAGWSVDCLPHGIYPAKVIGSQYLRFVDESNRLNAAVLYRFMDDIYLFDDDESNLRHDFYQLQRMLGDKNLTVNAEKTELGLVEELDIEVEVDEIKAELLGRRQQIIFGSGIDEPYEEEESLSALEIEYLIDLLKQEHLEEDDAELILALMRDQWEDVLEFIPSLISSFPALSKSFYYFAQHVEDKDVLLSYIHDFLKSSKFVSEFQLFWLAKVCERYLMKCQEIADVLALLLEHPSATAISRAKVLEIPENRFGMPDWREEELRTGASGWLAWSAAVGSRKIKKARRNHLLSYFGNSSPANRLIANCVRRL